MKVSTPKTEGKLMHHALRALYSFHSVFGVDTSITQKYYSDSLNKNPHVIFQAS